MINVMVEIDFKGHPMEPYDYDLINSLRKAKNDIDVLMRCILLYMSNTWRIFGESIYFRFKIID